MCIRDRPDREAAEEVAADAWLGCWRAAPAFRGDSRVLTWLLGIVKRQAYVRMRRVRPLEYPLDDEAASLADRADGPLEAVSYTHLDVYKRQPSCRCS